MSTYFLNWHEMDDVIGNILSNEKRHGCDGDFLAFILHCAERLNRGDSVQAIWRDYLNSKK